MTPLRQRMIEDMQLRNLTAATRKNYLHHVVGFAQYHRPKPRGPRHRSRPPVAAPSLKYRAALMTCYGAGLRVSEAVALKVADIDSQCMLLRVEQGKGQKDRYAMLSPRLLEVLRRYWRAARGVFPRGLPPILAPSMPRSPAGIRGLRLPEPLPPPGFAGRKLKKPLAVTGASCKTQG